MRHRKNYIEEILIFLLAATGIVKIYSDIGEDGDDDHEDIDPELYNLPKTTEDGSPWMHVGKSCYQFTLVHKTH